MSIPYLGFGRNSRLLMRSELRGRVQLLAYMVKSSIDNDHRSGVISSFTRVSLTSEYSQTSP